MRMTTPGRTIPQPRPGRPGKGRVGKHAGHAAPKRQDARRNDAPPDGRARRRGDRPTEEGG